MLRGLAGWSCVNVSQEVARRLGPIIEGDLEQSVRYLGDIYLTRDRPSTPFAHPAVRFLGLGDLALLDSAPPGLREAGESFGGVERLRAGGIVAGTVVEGVLMSLAWTSALSDRHADQAVATVPSKRGEGLATASAALVAARVQQDGRTPVWSAGEGNLASLRVARKLGFAEVGRRTYIVTTGGRPAAS